jgi:phage/plasmid-like protein (TIGR03299 family)
MTRESYEWLNENVKIGFGDKHGEAWWPMEQGFNNLYPGAIPMADAVEFFGRWKPVEVDILFETEDGKMMGDSENGKLIYRHQPGAKLHGKRLGLHSDGYQIHDRVEWLIKNVSQMIDGELAIGSLGELNKGRVAWVQIEAPETIEHSSGESFRPFIAATTSLDGSLATTYKAGSTRIVCDNTRDAFFQGSEGKYRVKHTRHSTSQHSIQSAREALDLVFKVTEDYVAEMDALLATTVSAKQWAGFLDSYVPLPTEDGRGKTMAENKRMALEDLWTNDDRVSPWKDTAWGVLQAANTYNTHLSIVRNADDRVERQWSNFLTGKTTKDDAKAMDSLNLILA